MGKDVQKGAKNKSNETELLEGDICNWSEQKKS